MTVRALRLALVVVAFGASALAAQAPIASYELQLYLAGVDPVAGAPFSVSTIPLTAVMCNQTPSTVPTAPLTNPRFVVWTDPVNAGKECSVDRSTYLLALPAGTNYRATLVAIAAASGTTPELRSARSAPSLPFTLAVVAPAAPVGLGFRP